MGAVFVKCQNFYIQVVLCDGQGAVRGAILYTDRFFYFWLDLKMLMTHCLNILFKIQIPQDPENVSLDRED